MEIDDSLPPLERFKVYLASSLLLHRLGIIAFILPRKFFDVIFQRLHVLRETADIVRNVGYEESVAHIVPLLPELAREQVLRLYIRTKVLSKVASLMIFSV